MHNSQHETDEEMHARFRREAELARQEIAATQSGIKDGSVYAVSTTPGYELFNIWSVKLSDGSRMLFDENHDPEAFERADAFIAAHQAPGADGTVSRRET